MKADQQEAAVGKRRGRKDKERQHMPFIGSKNA